METSNGAFEFVNGPARRRTKRIEPKEWERWRSRITELFLEVKLAEVVTRMQAEHGFCANERQYTHHLSKWGVTKQGRGTASNADPSPSQLDNLCDPACRDSLKRRRPPASIRTTSSTDSVLPRPPSKRVERNAAFRSNSTEPNVLQEESGRVCIDIDDNNNAIASTSLSVVPDADSQQRTESPAASVTGPTAPDTNRKTTLSDCSVSSDGRATMQPSDAPISLLQATEPNDLNGLVAQQPAPPIPSSVLDISTLSTIGLAETTDGDEVSVVGIVSVPERSNVSNNSPHDPVPSSPQRSASTDQPASPSSAPVIRVIDSNRPAETFSAQDISSIKHAAECLTMFCCNREAFELLTTILKRQLSHYKYRDKDFWYLVIQCANTASIPEHVEVIQNVIRAELSRLQQSQTSGVTAVTFLLHMLLALTSSRTRNVQDLALNLDQARALLDHERRALINLELPPDDRSLDLAVYHNLLRFQTGEPLDLTTPVHFKFLSVGFWSEVVLPLEDGILQKTPGPFGLQPSGRMTNPCIRSCLSWCEAALMSISSIQFTPGIAEFCKDELSITFAEANSLFITLWEHWVTSGPSAPESTWMVATQARMGISATELLLLVCRTIHDSDYLFERRPKLDDKLIQQVRKEAEQLMRQPDSELARRILKQYVSRSTVTLWPSWRKPLQRLEKARMMRSFENALHVRFPQLGDSNDLTQAVLDISSRPFYMSAFKVLREEGHGEVRFGNVNKAQIVSPTLASSLSSVDLSAFRKTGISAMLRLGDMFRGGGSTSLSTSHRRRLQASIAGATVSDLSTSLRSMSISGDSASRTRASEQVPTHPAASVRDHISSSSLRSGSVVALDEMSGPWWETGEYVSRLV